MFIRLVLVVVFSCVLTLVPGLSFGQGAGAPSGAAKLAGALGQQLLKWNEEMLAAQVRGDIAALDQLLTDDYTRLHAVGAVETKAEFLNGLKEPHFLAIQTSDVTVRVYGSTAILVGHALVKRVGDPDDHTTFMDVWVQQNGKWRVAAWVTTRIPQRAANRGAGN